MADRVLTHPNGACRRTPTRSFSASRCGLAHPIWMSGVCCPRSDLDAAVRVGAATASRRRTPSGSKRLDQLLRPMSRFLPDPLLPFWWLAAAHHRSMGPRVAIVGRPVARHLDDGWTLEVTRLATDGSANACSALYGAAWRTTPRRHRCSGSGCGPVAALRSGATRQAGLPNGWVSPSPSQKSSGHGSSPVTSIDGHHTIDRHRNRFLFAGVRAVD